MHLLCYRANPLHVLSALPVVSDMQMYSLGCVRDHLLRRRGLLPFLQRSSRGEWVRLAPQRHVPVPVDAVVRLRPAFSPCDVL